MKFHEFGAFYNEQSEILILGSFPSVKSREAGFYYQHPQNRFWKVLAAIFENPIPKTIEEQKLFLLREKISLWDVIESCEIKGSSDSSIKNVTPNRIEDIIKDARIRNIYANGAKAFELYNRYCNKMIQYPIKKLPSTSSANAAWTIEKLIDEWKIIKR